MQRDGVRVAERSLPSLRRERYVAPLNTLVVCRLALCEDSRPCAPVVIDTSDFVRVVRRIYHA